MSARIDQAGKVYQLDRQAEPDEAFSEEDAKDAKKLSRVVFYLLRDVATLKRRFWPKTIDFEDREVLSGDALRLTHKLGARVRWWVVDWQPTAPTDSPVFERSSATTLDVLVLDVGNPGTVTIRVEVAG